MGRRKYPRPCDNPLCRKPIQPDQVHSLTIRQVWPDGFRRSWEVCDPVCLRQYLALCAARDDAQARRQATASPAGDGDA